MKDVYRQAIRLIVAGVVGVTFWTLSGGPPALVMAGHEGDTPPPLGTVEKTQAGPTRVPGVDLSRLTEPQWAEAIRRLNSEQCTCGCGLSLLRCRVDDSTCPVSLERARQIVAEVAATQLPPRVPLPAGAPPEESPSQVFINGRPLTQEQLREVQRIYGLVPRPGRYWYDPMSGLTGNWGREPTGTIRPGHNFGPLPADASHGDTAVFINARRITRVELDWLLEIFEKVHPGRYWLDGRTGNIGIEGNPRPIANVRLAAQQAEKRAQESGRGHYWRDRYSGASGGSSGGCVWIHVPGKDSVSSAYSGCD